MKNTLVTAVIAALLAAGLLAAVNTFAAGTGKAKGFGNVEVQVKEARSDQKKGPGIAGAQVTITPDDATAQCQGRKPQKGATNSNKGKGKPTTKPTPHASASPALSPIPQASAQATSTTTATAAGAAFTAATGKNGKVTARGCTAGTYTVSVVLPDGFTIAGEDSVQVTVGEKKKVKVYFSATGASQRGNSGQATHKPESEETESPGL